jgi:hypothetical protein
VIFKNGIDNPTKVGYNAIVQGKQKLTQRRWQGENNPGNG